MQLRLTAHARARMQQRKASEADIRWVLFDPDDIEQYNGEAMAIKTDIDRVLKVVYEKVSDETYKVITVIAQRRRVRRK